MHITAYKTHPIKPKEDLFKILDSYLPPLSEKSVVVITSKIVSLSQGRVIKKIKGSNKHRLIQQEADQYLSNNTRYDVELTIKNNILIANAGIDESNADGNYVLWPEELQGTVNTLWNYLKTKHKLNSVGVLMTDSRLAPLRWGTLGITLAYCGFKPLHDYRGQPDIFKRDLQMTQAAIADGIAAAAVVSMGEGNEQTPLVVVTDLPFVEFQDHPPTAEELKNFQITPDDDIFASVINYDKFKRQRK